jgi:hypothetical protein
MRLIKLNTVVLPAPLGPIKVNTSPSLTSKLTLLTANTPPNRTVKSRADNKGCGLAAVDVFEDAVLEDAPIDDDALAIDALAIDAFAIDAFAIDAFAIDAFEFALVIIGPSFQTVRLSKSLLALEHAFAVERKQLKPSANF